MSVEQDIAIIQHADPADAASAVVCPLELFTSRQANARPVIRSPKQLQLHKALEQVGWKGVNDEFTDAIRSKNTPAEPVLITASGIILAGFGRWRLAVFECRQEIQVH